MTKRTEYRHGDFCWVDLGTTDATAAKKFYTGLFGWQYADMPAGPDMTYTVCNLGSQAAAGLYAMTKDMLSRGVPPHWLPHINVTSVDETTKRATQNGAKVIREPFDAMDAGRLSIMHDPTGAVVAMWQAKKHIGAQVINEPGAMCWNELATSNVDAAGKFYRATFGWTAEQMDMGPGGTYTIFKAGDERVGGMMALTPQMKGVPPHWLTYFAVADCDGTAKKVTELGGQVLVPPTDIPEVGRFAVSRDGQGTAFAFIKLQ
jgi:uncharacterized protein